jgi:type I restriction enzyme S subunit
MDAIEPGKRWVAPTQVRGSRSGARFRGGDVLFARITPCLENGKVAQYPPALGRAGGSTELIVLRASPDIEPGFLYHWATAVETRQRATELMVGSTGRQRVSPSDLASMRLQLPPLAEQRRIVDVMDQVDRVRWRTVEARGAAEAALSAAREALLGRPASMQTELGELLEEIDAGRSPRCEDRPPRSDEIGVLKVSAIRFNEFEPAESKTLPPGAAFADSHRVRLGDLLMSRANGSLHLVGAACRVDDDVTNLLLSDKTLRLRVDPDALDRDFALHVLLSRSLRVQIERDATGSSGQKNISQSQIKSLVIPVPPPQEQCAIAATLEAFASDVRARSAAVLRADALRASIGARLLTGHHRIPETYDHLVSENGAVSSLEPAVT